MIPRRLTTYHAVIADVVFQVSFRSHAHATAQSRQGLAVGLMCALGFTGCATVQGIITGGKEAVDDLVDKFPKTTVETIRPGWPGTTAIPVYVHLLIANPNDFAVPLQAIDGALYLSESYVGPAVAEGTPSLEAKQTTPLTLTISAQYANLGSPLKDALTKWANGESMSMPYRFTGTVTVRLVTKDVSLPIVLVGQTP